MNTINDTRWQEWTDKFLSAKKEQMTEQQAEAYLHIMLSDNAKLDEKLAAIPQQFPLAVFDAHAKKLGLKVETKAKVLFAAFVAHNPGTVVMYVHALRRFAQKKGLTAPLTLMDLHGTGDAPFAVGYLSDDTLHTLWDEQKVTKEDRENGFVGPDNYLDYVGDPEAKS